MKRQLSLLEHKLLPTAFVDEWQRLESAHGVSPVVFVIDVVRVKGATTIVLEVDGKKQAAIARDDVAATARELFARAFPEKKEASTCT